MRRLRWIGLWSWIAISPCYGDVDELYAAIAQKPTEALRAYLDAGGDPNAIVRGNVSAQNDAAEANMRDLPLIGWALFKRNDPAAVLLLRSGADPEYVNLWPSSFLARAADFGLQETVRFLIDENPHAMTPGEGPSPLGTASEWGYREIVADMLQAATRSGIVWGSALDEALEAAASQGHIDVMNLLIGAGANVNTPGVWAWAIRGQKPPVVQALLDAGWDVASRDEDSGVQGLDLAILMLDGTGRTRESKEIVGLVGRAAPDACHPLSPALLSRLQQREGQSKQSDLEATRKALFELLPQCPWATLLPVPVQDSRSPQP